MIVVSNSTPLIHLAKAGKLGFLREIYRQIYIPQEVWRDLMKPIEEHWTAIPADVPRIQEAKNQGWLVVKDPKEPRSLELVAEISLNLGMGESFSITLSRELKADFLLANDRGAVEKAQELRIKTKWVSEILLDALAAGLMKNAKEYEEVLEGMRRRGLWMTTPFFREAVVRAQQIGRSPRGA